MLRQFVPTFTQYLAEAAKADMGQTLPLGKVDPEMQKAILEYKQLNDELMEIEQKFNISMKQDRIKELEKGLLKQMEELQASRILGEEVVVVVEKFNYQRGTIQWKGIVENLVKTNVITKEMKETLEKEFVTISNVKGNLQVSSGEGVQESWIGDKLSSIKIALGIFVKKILGQIDQRDALQNEILRIAKGR